MYYAVSFRCTSALLLVSVTLLDAQVGSKGWGRATSVWAMSLDLELYPGTVDREQSEMV